MEKFKEMTVGQIVADNIETADVLSKFGIDFCCNGSDDFMTAVEKAGANADIVIEVMKIEHEAEGERYRHIEDLTGGYEAPKDACTSYRKVMKDLKEFNRELHEHIHLENNIVFPAAIDLAIELE